MTTKKILNTKLKDIIKYCDNNSCADKCPYEKICLYRCTFSHTEYTLVPMISALAEELEND